MDVMGARWRSIWRVGIVTRALANQWCCLAVVGPDPAMVGQARRYFEYDGANPSVRVHGGDAG